MTDSLTYSSGQVSAITNTTSGRSLHFTWSTPSGATSPHVATVTTDPVTAGQSGTAQTWTYGYNGDLLSTVCMPGMSSDCIHYSYVTNGSHAATSNQLPGAGTVQAQYSAETHPAAELASVTSPAGRTELSATYDTVNDRVSTLTDVHGGKWTYTLPVSASLSAAYDDAVLSSSPTDFWPLSDSSGPPASNLVNGASTSASPRPPATYTNVSLGNPGPTAFTDGTSATFSGSGSQISIPGGYFAGSTNNGAESAELWFSTTATSGTLLSTGAGDGNGNPAAIWIDSSGCLNGSAGAMSLAPSGLGGKTSCTKVNDGKWHQVVLTVTPVTHAASSAQGSYLYLDGSQLYNATATSPAAVSGTGYTAYIGNGPKGDFTGSIADVSLYTSQLSTQDVTGHFNAVNNAIKIVSSTNASGQPTSYLSTPTLNTQTITVTDPAGKNAQYVYGGAALVRTVSVLGGTTYYGYDAAMRAATITDPDGDTTYTTHDAHGNITSTTTCATVNDCQTSYAAYYENPSSPLDPRNDKPTDDRDPRSQSSSDPAYDTVTTYTASGLIATTRTPPTAACPSGCLTTHTYTSGSEAAVGGGTEPAGLLASVTTPGGGTATYAYDAAGDLMTATDPLGLVTKYTYNNLGWELTKTDVSDTYPAGLTTSFTRDGMGRILTKTNPPVTDRVTGAVHTEVFTYTYDPDGLLLTSTISDSTGGDPSRTTTYTYDTHRNLSSIKDPLGNTTSFTSDDFANTTSVTDPAGRTFTYSYDDLRHLLTTTLDGYTGNPSSPQSPVNLVEESRAYDPAGRLASATDVQGTQTDYTYYGDNLLASSYIPDPGSSTRQSDVTAYSYDPEGNITQKSSPGGLVVTNVVNAANQVVSSTADPAGADLTTNTTYDPDGNVTASSLTGGGTTETTTATYNTMDQPMSSTVVNGNTSLTTSYQRDERGLVTSVTDPAGNLTSYQNDELGRPVVQTLPAVQSQNGSGGAAVTANPVYTTGYDTFGDVTKSADADGNITTAAFNPGGQQTSVTAPSYTPPGGTGPVNGTTTMTWNSIGQETSATDPLGNKTQMAYDQLGDLASQTDADGGTWTYAYDAAGEQTSVTDPTGAQTQATYDSRGRKITSTQLVRQNTSAADTTSYGYDDASNQTSVTTPAGVTTTAAYNPLGEMTSSTDGGGNTTSYAYNLNGQAARATLPDGSGATAAYDQAGRITGISQLNAAGTVLRTASAGYDADSNLTSSTDFRGTTTTATYDPTGELTALTQPVTTTKNIQLGYGYDLNGNLTQQTSGNGNTTWTTYNSRSLPQTVTEPPTARYTSAADSTTTNMYDAAGNLVSQTLPGGTQITSSYDPMGRVLTESGTGATAATAARTYTYDTAGRMLTAATAAAGTQGSPGYQPATNDTFSYDDRGLLLAAAGSAGASGFGYNASGQLTTATDPSGTSSYTYSKAGLLATGTDAASGTTGSYSYNKLNQVTAISYGTGNDTRSYTYDPMHRLASDTLSTATGAQAAAISYGYDTNNDITTMTTSGLATAGGGTGTVTNTYGYDLASRLTSWTATPASGTAATTSYGYDSDGNLTSNGAAGYSYDARDQLTSDSKGNTYSYAADGDLSAQTASGGAVTSYTSDAYGQQITDAGSSYTWDALDRVTAATAGTASIALTYSGATGQLTSDGTATYSRDPSGALIGINSTTAGRTLALTNQHDDLVGTFTPAAAALASSATYDPWGQVIAATGPAVQIGYQGQWTDPLTGQVNMGSRFYNPAHGNFNNHDTTPAGNPYAYAGDNPVTVTDLTGHSPDGTGTGAGTITQAQVDQAKARAADARTKAQRAKSAAAQARNAEAQAATALNAAADYARQMNSKAAQAHQAATEAKQQADQAQQTLDADLSGYASLQALADAVNKDQAAVNQAQDNLNAAQNAPDYQEYLALNCGGRVSDVPPGSCTQTGGGDAVPSDCKMAYYDAAQTVSDAEQTLQTTEKQLQNDQGLYTTAKPANDAYQRLKSKAETLWQKAQKADDTAASARVALSLAQATYNQARTTASRLTKDAAKAEQAAESAENEYQKLKKAYDDQQKAKKKKKHPKPGPAPCSTSCVTKPFPPRPIRPPETVGSTPNPGSSPGPGPGQGSNPGTTTSQTSPPGDTPSPSTGGAGQGSGNGGSGSGQPTAPSCSDSGGGSAAQGAASLGELFANGKVPSASELELFGISQGWTASQTPSGPLKFIDQNGITRMTLKSGSPRTPGSGSPHAEFRDPTGQRIDPFGNSVERRSRGNHTPIEWDC
jgi:RHS repeat-associated protein